MEVHRTRLAGLLLLVPHPHRDERGFFTRTFDTRTADAAGIDPAGFVQDSQSRSRQGVVRGLHGRGGRGEAKLVRCARGAVWDVVVDARPDSETFGEWLGHRLDDETHHQLYVPTGLLHGHLTLTPEADVCYRIDAEHDPSEDLAVHHLDPDLAIRWPAPITMVSAKDQASGSWAHLVSTLGGGVGDGS